MMKKLFLIALLASAYTGAFAQNYFQQEVNYRISATLDDQSHTLTGEVEIEYHNNAPQPQYSI